MRISDWSSDVCSSDLVAVDLGRRLAAVVAGVPAGRHRGPAAADPGLHVLVVLGVPRPGGGGFGVSLDWAGIGDSAFRNPSRGALSFIPTGNRPFCRSESPSPNPETRFPTPPIPPHIYNKHPPPT